MPAFAERHRKKDILLKGVLIFIALLMLISVYTFQRVSVSRYLIGLIGIEVTNVHPYIIFILNKTIRLVLNDLACVMLIVALFREKKYLWMGFYVFLFEILVLLPLYFALKLSTEGDSEISSPLLSQIHRMIVNPTLMILLIASFFYQRFQRKDRHE